MNFSNNFLGRACLNAPNDPQSRTRFYRYRLAGREIAFDQSLALAAPFFVGFEPLDLVTNPPGNLQKPTTPPQIQTEGWLVDRTSVVALSYDASGYWLSFPEDGLVWVAPGGETIVGSHLAVLNNTDSRQQAILVGPPLVFALALQGTWCLHASAVEHDGKVVAFVGDSGTGKSTLAKFLGKQPGWHLAADDILPVRWENGKLLVWPRFPQLKIPVDSQPSVALAEALPLVALNVLDDQPDISSTRLEPLESTLALLGGTAATRLFPPSLLASHLDFCSLAGKSVPVRNLAYPRRYDALLDVARRVLADLEPQND